MSELGPDQALSFDLLVDVANREREAAQSETRQRIVQPLAASALAWIAASEWLPRNVANALALTTGDPSPVANLAEAGYLDPLPEGDWIVTYSGIGACLDELSRRRVNLLDDLQSSASMLSSEILTPPQQRLVELVNAASVTQPLAEVFEQRVEECIAGDAPNRLLEWIETGRPLAMLFAVQLDRSVELAVERAQRRHDLLRRQKTDRQHLLHFQERKEQLDALDELLQGPDDLWALHFLGSGGVGKTMLLRHIAANVAGSVARIDFDYLSADYPRRDPGLFLSSFIEDLRLRERGELRASESFDRAEDYFEQVRAHAAEHHDAQYRASADPAFVEGVANYILALRELPRPLILILDTCEELMKVRPDGKLPESLEETFKILRALREGPEILTGEAGSGGVPELRVIFAGRRLLARSGYGWHAETSALPPQPFLRLHELRGFDDREARDYLRELGAPPELTDDILDRSPEVARAAKVVIDGATAGAEDRRFNPYMLSFFGRWAAAEPELAKEAIPESSGKRYIEIRVLQSIRYEPLRQVLPLIAQAKHVDRELLAEVTPLSDHEVDAVLDELAVSEWADARHGGVSIKPDIQRELVAYYNEVPSEAASLLPAAAAYLRRLTETMLIEGLDWTDFDAAARLLRPQESAFIAWWRGVEERAIRERDFKWLLDVTSPMRDEDGAGAAEGESGNPLRPWILASYAAAVLHERPEETAGVWAEVMRAMGGRAGGEWDRLRRRAVLGLLATKKFIEDRELAEAFRNASPDLHAGVVSVRFAELSAAVVAAVENVVDHLELLEFRFANRQYIAEQLADAARTLLSGLAAGHIEPKVLRVFLLTLLGRLSVLASDRTNAVAAFRYALQLSTIISSAPAFRDWVPPDDFRARVQLEVARLCPALFAPDVLLPLLGELPKRITNADSERLYSHVLRMQAALRVPAIMPAVEELLQEETTFPSRCAAHVATVPLALQVARVHAAAGRLSAAVELLQRMTDADARRELLHLSRRMRLYEEGIGIPSNMSDVQREIWALNALVGIQPQLSRNQAASTVDLHAAWSASNALTEDARSHVSTTARLIRNRMNAEWEWKDVQQAHLELDVIEADLIERRPVDDRVWWIHSVSSDPEIKLALELRIEALRADSQDIDGLAKSIGVRRAAEIALEIGESLYLRLPENAIGVFDRALNWFGEIKDGVGSFLSAANRDIAAVTAFGIHADTRDHILHTKWLYNQMRSVDVDAHLRELDARLWSPWLGRLTLLDISAEGRLTSAGDVRSRYGRKVDGKWRLSVDVEQILAATIPKMQSPPQTTRSSELGRFGVTVAVAIAAAVGVPIAWFVGRWVMPTALLVDSPAVRALVTMLVGIGSITAVILAGTVYQLVKEKEAAGAGLMMSLLAALFLTGRYFAKPYLQRTTVSVQVAIFACLIVVFGVLLLYLRGVWTSLAASKAKVTLEVASDAHRRRASEAYETTLTLTISPSTLRLFPSFRFVRGEASVIRKADLTTTGFKPYAVTSKDNDVRKRLTSLAAELGSRSVDLTVQTTVADAGAPWEAFLADADGRWPKKKRLVPRRVTADAAPSRRSARWQRPLDVTTWAPRVDLARNSAAQAWADAPGLHVTDSTGARVVHIEGIFEERLTGMGVRTDVFRGQRMEGLTETAASLPHRFQKMELCIVQPIPMRGMERGEADRQDAVLSRRFAAELFSLGIPAVVVVPRVMYKSGVAVLAPFVSLLSRATTLDAKRLQRAVRQAQIRVAADFGAGTPAAFEAMCDVVLFCRDDWRVEIG